MNSKYAPLESHLRDSGETSVPMTFDEIAQVIGTPLPPAAFKHRALWSNNPGNWVMTKAWLGAGYETERVHMETRELVFRKVSDVPPPATSARLAPTDGAGRAAVPGFRDIRIDAVVEDVNRRLDDVVRDLANLRERVAKLEGSLEGFLAGRRDRDAGRSVYVGDRERNLDQLYATLEEIAEGPVGLTELSRRIVRADPGVYLFFEQGEVRRNGRPRVVRVGKSVKLQSRLLDQHLNGNHRASVFRRHVGEALIRRDRLPGLETWLKSTAPSLQTERDSERDVEDRVTQVLGAMSVAWIATRDHEWIEKNLIGLLSHGDRPSAAWLGSFSQSRAIMLSGLWNIDYVGDDYDSDVLDRLRR